MRRVLILITFILFPIATSLALTFGRVDPLVRNIIYFHVPSSICALLCFCVIFIAIIAVLTTAAPRYDHLAAATAEVGLIFATVLNLTGSVFSRVEWNTWWTPSPRLITSAILWFLYIGYLILRSATPPARRARIAAVFGIIAFLDVPLVYISARFTADIHRPGFSFDSTWQTLAFTLSLLATCLLAATLIWIRYDILKIKANLDHPTPQPPESP